MKMLITGFEPFGGSAVNPSQKVIDALPDGVTGIKIIPVLLPVDRDRGPAGLLAALASQQPDAVICLGEAAGRYAISIERVAINLLDFRIPDNSGHQVVDEQVVPGGPPAYFVTLPVRHIQESIQKQGIPVELSLSAGAYLCNQVLYQLLHHLSITGVNIPAGFIHLPALPEQSAARPQPIPSMSLEMSLHAVMTAVNVIANPLD